MRQKIIYQHQSFIFKRAIFAALIFTTICINIKAQPGTIDNTFDPGIGANNNVNTIAIQSDGKIIIGGYFTSYNGTARNHIARLNTNGSLDLTFNPGTGANDVVWTTAIQSDGKIIIFGRFTSYNGTTRNSIARLNTDGSIDPTFIQGTGANDDIRESVLQSDGKIIIGGDFTAYNGTARNRIARLKTDGSLDETFNPGTGVNGFVYALALQSDGKIIIGGLFGSYNGTTRNRIARINVDGSLDATFNPGTGAGNDIIALAIQNDGKIIIGGWFTSYNGTLINYIARLNIDGNLDATFNPGTGANNSVCATTMQSDGKIIIGGWFTAYNGTSINRIARLNTNGSLDATFNPGTGINNDYTSTTTIQSDGKIIIGGQFTSYNGISRNYIVRINGGNVGISSVQTETLSLFPNPISNELNIEIAGNKDLLNFEILNLFGQVVFKGNVLEKTTVKTSEFEPGVYLLRLYNLSSVAGDQAFEIKKIIIE